MEEVADQQRIKMIEAASYDYESDPRWAEYWSNILIPPHMASRSDVVVDHFKLKFYQRYIDPDLVVEAMYLASSSQSARASANSSSPRVSENARPRNQGSSSGTSAPSARNANSLALDRRTIRFSVNAWVLIVAVLGMLPYVPRALSNKAYRLSLLGTTCSSLYSVYSLYGVPKVWSLLAIQSWFQAIIASKDFIHSLYCLVLVSSQLHLKFALVPLFCWSLEHVAKFLRRNFARSSLYRRYLEQPCLFVESNVTTFSILSSNAEIALGFLLVISLFSQQRNLLLTFMYWQLLKLMYHAPVTSGYHQGVWAMVSRTTNPVRRYTPFLNSPIAAIQRWWFR